MLRTLLFIFLGGGIGSGLRYLTSVLIQRNFTSHFPLATWISNFVGCLLIGILIGFFTKNEFTNSDIKWFLVTGFCGGFTTFSAFSYENVTLMQHSNFGLSFFYIFLSIISGLLAVWFGLYITK